MTKRHTTKAEIEKRIRHSDHSVFFRSDFEDLASYSQVGNTLRRLMDEKLLIKIGYGVYVRSRINQFNGKLIPDNYGGTDETVIKALTRLGVSFKMDELSTLYLEGKITQVPANIQIKTTNPRFTRKIKIGQHKINYHSGKLQK